MLPCPPAPKRLDDYSAGGTGAGAESADTDASPGSIEGEEEEERTYRTVAWLRSQTGLRPELQAAMEFYAKARESGSWVRLVYFLVCTFNPLNFIQVCRRKPCDERSCACAGL